MILIQRNTQLSQNLHRDKCMNTILLFLPCICYSLKFYYKQHTLLSILTVSHLSQAPPVQYKLFVHESGPRVDTDTSGERGQTTSGGPCCHPLTNGAAIYANHQSSSAASRKEGKRGGSELTEGTITMSLSISKQESKMGGFFSSLFFLFLLFSDSRELGL